MPMMRFAQRLTGDFNVKVKTLIKIEPTNINDATNNNSGVVTTDPVFSRVDFSTIGSFKRYVSPFKLLNIPATHSTARIILTSNGLLALRPGALSGMAFSCGGCPESRG